jgi:O-acetyl-ADP-ribose deacetylase (regulator of RNase III)
MGSGIAPFFRRRSEAMYLVYKEACQKGELLPGEVFAWPLSDHARPQWIYNCATQVKQGRNANYVLVALAAHNMMMHALQNNVRTIGIPAIGCGIGGLEWERVSYILDGTFGPNKDVTLTAVLRGNHG